MNIEMAVAIESLKDKAAKRGFKLESSEDKIRKQIREMSISEQVALRNLFMGVTK